MNRAKKPFSAPIRFWLRDLSEKYLSDSRLVKDGVLAAGGLASYMKFDGDKALHSSKLWLVLMLEIWYRIYFYNELGNT
jgi:hypothetical protein